MKTRAARLAWLAFCACHALSPRLHAGEGAEPARLAEDPVADARQHFQRGVLFYREGNNDAALAEFVRAQELTPSFRILYNLAQVQAERGDAAAALAFFTQYLREGGELISPERRTEVARAQAELAARVGRLDVEADAPGAQLYVNGAFVATLPLAEPLLVNAGRCEVRVEHAGHLPSVRSIVIASGQSRELFLRLEANEPAPRPTTPPAPAKSAGPGTPFWIGLGATASLGTLTAGFALATALENKPERTRAEAESARASGSRLETYAWLTGAFGAATLLSAGATTYFMLAGGGSEAQLSSAQRARGRAGLSARVVPAPNGVYLLGAF